MTLVVYLNVSSSCLCVFDTVLLMFVDFNSVYPCVVDLYSDVLDEDLMDDEREAVRNLLRYVNFRE